MPVLKNQLHMLPVGGDAAVMKTTKQAPLIGNVVKTIQDGGITVRFCDDYVERTPEGIARVLDNFDEALWAIVDGLRAAGEDV